MRSIAAILILVSSQLLVLGVTTGAFAMTAPLKLAPNKISPAISDGAAMGGTASDSFTLTAVNRENLPNGEEKWIIGYGDRGGRPLVAGPGFFQVSVDRNSRRVLLDLAQVARSLVATSALDKIVKESRLVGSSDLTMDPVDHSTNITLNMKSPVAVQVVSDTSNGGRLVLFLKPTLPAKAVR